MFYCVTRFFYKQRQAEIAKKNKQKLSNTLSLNFRQMKIIRFLHQRYYLKLTWDSSIKWRVLLQPKFIISRHLKQFIKKLL